MKARQSNRHIIRSGPLGTGPGERVAAPTPHPRGRPEKAPAARLSLEIGKSNVKRNMPAGATKPPVFQSNPPRRLIRTGCRTTSRPRCRRF